MKYRDREELRDAVEVILSASDEAVENLEEEHIVGEIKKIRSMEE